jgi:phage gp16-like protein
VSVGEHRARPAEEEAEIALLRARVAALETELVEVEAWANRAVASAEERVYWLDRWHLDLNRLMERPGAAEFRAALRAVRAAYRLLNRVRRRLRSHA